MGFDPTQYSADVRAILHIDGNGTRLMPLTEGPPVHAGLRMLSGKSAQQLFPDSYSPEAALSGLYLYFGGYDESHSLSQEIASPEGSFWHGIMHRQEPDPANAGYWFRRVGEHPVFPALRDAAEAAGFSVREKWDPFSFIDFCDRAGRKPGSREEKTAMAVQLAEWQLLFDYCARPRS